jgi:hypothetical protein
MDMVAVAGTRHLSRRREASNYFFSRFGANPPLSAA